MPCSAIHSFRLHASAFYQKTKEIEANSRLLEFLKDMKSSNVKILVYTRGLPNQPSDELRKRWNKIVAAVGDPSVRDRYALFQMPVGQSDPCFDNPDNGMPFKRQVKKMLGL
jgi:hypothetical protein